jgi:hypothetical protein
MEIQGKRKAPNGMYWGNIEIQKDIYKCVMVEPLDENIYRAWSNSQLALRKNSGFTISDKRVGWAYKDLGKNEFKIFDW